MCKTESRTVKIVIGTVVVAAITVIIVLISAIAIVWRRRKNRYDYNSV